MTTPHIRRIAGQIVFCISLLWAGGEAIYGTGMYRVTSIVMLIIGGVTLAGAAHDRIRPRPKRRKAREQHAGN
ncbi:hypothetical protein [Streptomyces sp. NPDC002588]|uniref:hypothetical protein n=1 Tax=Streptomyces sp. NPDC002588 TaxID=3154419 RepID=UPI00331AD96B